MDALKKTLQKNGIFGLYKGININFSYQYLGVESPLGL